MSKQTRSSDCLAGPPIDCFTIDAIASAHVRPTEGGPASSACTPANTRSRAGRGRSLPRLKKRSMTMNFEDSSQCCRGTSKNEKHMPCNGLPNDVQNLPPFIICADHSSRLRSEKAEAPKQRGQSRGDGPTRTPVRPRYDLVLNLVGNTGTGAALNADLSPDIVQNCAICRHGGCSGAGKNNARRRSLSDEHSPCYVVRSETERF